MEHKNTQFGGGGGGGHNGVCANGKAGGRTKNHCALKS